MLVRSSTSLETTGALGTIVRATAAVIFLGTPHRGSQDVAALGEVVRSVVSSFGIETTEVNLNALGLKTTDLERAQEDFSKIWLKYDFQVKTFQEGLSLPKLGKKVVPDYSSLIGDHREHAETLQANHLLMCRYSGPDDPNYRKVAGELHCVYRSILKVKAIAAPPNQAIQRGPSPVPSVPFLQERPYSVNSIQVNEACLESLWFPAINNRHQTLERPADQTCSWLFTHELYRDWFNSRNRQKSYGLLWLKGKPGAGKSTLMKEAFRRMALEQVESDYLTAAFFFNAKGDELEHSTLGLFRSLLYQLLPKDKKWLQNFHNIWYEKKKFQRSRTGEEASLWAEKELRVFFESRLTQQTQKRTFIFIDALDECDERGIRSVAYFWREITKSAYERGIDLNVCLSSRHFPTISLSDCPEIIVEQHNYDDIAAYVEYKFKICMSTQEAQWELLIKTILNKSAGIFLWVVLVVEEVLKNKDEGNGMPYLIKRVADVPEELETLFSEMISNLDPHAKELTAKFFQWAILATKPLRLHEWHHIMACIRQPTLNSLREWRQSDNFIENDEQLEKQIRGISKGLVEVKQVRAGEREEVDVTSNLAGAGSLDLEHGDTRIVQVIHESVRNFFLASNGFSMLDPSLQSNPIGNGHLSIMATCLDYINIHELDALVEARIHAAKHRLDQERLRNPVRSGSYRSKVLRSPDFTSRNSQARHQKFVYGKEHQLSYESIGIRDKEHAVFETLRSLDCSPAVDINKWIDGGFSAGRISPEGSPCESATHSCDLSQCQILEDHPALLSYATFKLFTHAQLADRYKADLRSFIERLKDEAIWARWVALREDVPHGTTLSSYASDMGLWTEISDSSDDTMSDSDAISWEIWHCEAIKKDAERGGGGGGGAPRSARKEIGERQQENQKPKYKVIRKEKYRKRRRARSVASFSSAGSHRA